MTRDQTHRDRIDVEEVSEGVDVQYHDPTRRDDVVGALDQPWIGDEGSMEADFRQVFEPVDLRPQGLAFDQETTIFWDEDAVMEVRKAATRKGELAFVTPVLVRDRFPAAEGMKLWRIDVLKEGALRASRYQWRPAKEGAGNA